MDHSFYQNTLYPLQDYILALVSKLGLPFYLTGGTALSRHFLQHRYSDDLDLFVNGHPNFRELVAALESEFKSKQLSFQALARSADFVRLEVFGKDATPLKLDLVNDLAGHFGGFEESSSLGRVDNIFNILSNKISAIPRLEIKDFADVVCIAGKYRFNWEKVIGEALQKDEWVNPLDLARYFFELDAARFEQIRWIDPVRSDDIKKRCEQLADDIVRGSDNSLAEAVFR